MKSSFDVLIVVDCAPTGETMKLISNFPDLFKTFMKKVFPIEKKSG